MSNTSSAPALHRARPINLFLLVALIGAGCSSVAEGGAPPTPTWTPQEEAGASLFSRHCTSCHSTLPETIIVGPSLAGVAERASLQVEGLNARAYLEASIKDPGGYLVDGYPNLMPTGLGDSLAEKEVEALVAYLLTLK